MILQARRRASTLLLAFAAPAAFAQTDLGAGTPAADRLGDHPAVVVQRLQRSAGYDYASKFYLHPAHLYLLSAAPDELERMAFAAQASRIDNTPDTVVPETLASRGRVTRTTRGTPAR